MVLGWCTYGKTQWNVSTDGFTAVFAALSDLTRRALLARLADGEATVNELAAPHPLTLPSVSRHLKVLEKAGLVTKTRTAQWRSCRLNPSSLPAMDQWMVPYRQFFESRLDGLDKHLMIGPSPNYTSDNLMERDDVSDTN
nr:metalloregulator ArsR/SmtB family transcription factor [Cryobacterium algoritolerans]